MSCIAYREKKIRGASLAIIAQANEILEEYAGQGFDLTLRQLYYQFVARGLIENTTRSYKRMGGIIDDGRMCGLIDWKRIEDRTRHSNTRSCWEDPRGILYSCYHSFHMNRWVNQDNHVEVWVEKEALVGVFASICHDLDVPYFACRGYVSQSEMWRAAQRIHGYQAGGQHAVILHFGDHDPSGLDMTRDIESRLMTFRVSSDFEVRRLALNMDQVEEFNPPPNPAKDTDARFAGYVARYGDESWELDALQPQYLIKLVRKTVDEYRDMKQWKKICTEEKDARARLQVVAEQWDSVSEYLGDNHAEDLEQAADDLAKEYKVELGARKEEDDDDDSR